jgi:esterase/lipase superfamily enzyme
VRGGWQAVLASLLLGGCATLPGAGAPACHLVPVGSDGRPNVTVFYATNRARDDRPDNTFSYGFERSDALTFGRAVVSLPRPGTRSFGSIADLRIILVTRGETPDAFMAALNAYAKTRPQGHRDALIYVHGFSNTFERSMARTAQFFYDGCLDAVPVVFSWPSRGSFFDRSYDEDSATFSRDAAAKLLQLVRSSRVVEDTHVMAHSMGNWIVLEALKSQPAASSWRPPIAGKTVPAISTAVLASPDVDLDVFRQELRAMRRSARTVVLLTSRRDLILGIAKFLAHGAPRAGDASDEELARANIEAAGNFSVIRMDTPEVGRCPGLGHRCETANPVILRRITDLIGRTGGVEPDGLGVPAVGPLLDSGRSSLNF